MNSSTPYLLSTVTFQELKKRTVQLAVLPWGATEAHNYHLPYGTDNIEAEHIASAAAALAWNAGTDLIVLPVIPFGVNTGQADILLDMNLNPSTQRAILGDLITVLNRQGIQKLLIVNSHGGNDFKAILRELGLQFPEMMLCTCNWFQSLNRSEYFEEPGDHADELETSLMLHIAPETVRPLQIAGTGAEKRPRIQAFREGWAWMERKWSQVTEDTGTGNPHKSTAEKGAAYFEQVTKKMARLMTDIALADRNDLYL